MISYFVMFCAAFFLMFISLVGYYLFGVKLFKKDNQ